MKRIAQVLVMAAVLVVPLVLAGPASAHDGFVWAPSPILMHGYVGTAELHRVGFVCDFEDPFFTVYGEFRTSRRDIETITAPSGRCVSESMPGGATVTAYRGCSKQHNGRVVGCSNWTPA